MSDYFNVADIFGENVFNDTVMQERLPKKVYKKLHEVMDEGKELDLETADVIAHEMKEWAIEKGATHYTHWFQPLTGVTAEKHDSFITAPMPNGKVLMSFSGEELVNILLNKGDRNIGLIGWEQGDATWLGRWEGYKAGVDKWNEEHPDDQAKLSEPQYAGTTSEGGSKAAEALMAADPNLDALIPAGGGGDPLQGAIAAVERAGKTADIDVVSTDFLPDLGDRLENGSMAGESGGHFCDPLIAFMMVYNAVKGNYKDFGGKFEDVPFPYLYVSSADDYKNYEKYFVDQLPYTDQELVDMSKLSLEDLRITAQSVSIEDAAARAGK